MTTNTLLTVDQVVVQTEGNLVSDMNGETVLMSVAQSKYYNMGQIGGRIWELIQQPSAVGQVIDQLLEEYEIDRSTCEAHVIAFLSNLNREGLVRINE